MKWYNAKVSKGGHLMKWKDKSLILHRESQTLKIWDANVAVFVLNPGPRIGTLVNNSLMSNPRWWPDPHVYGFSGFSCIFQLQLCHGHVCQGKCLTIFREPGILFISTMHCQSSIKHLLDLGINPQSAYLNVELLPYSEFWSALAGRFFLLLVLFLCDELPGGFFPGPGPSDTSTLESTARNLIKWLDAPLMPMDDRV